ncbi:MAG: 30S ribosomal protein S16 [Bacteroidales bacterium]|jgi:small subunit ribosomal protein S16|nr:30S ribosomal protein S16 [Bacteroidales bacterium]
MPVKMRLTRHGRKRYAYYHIVIADSRAPRDGRYVERIGSYNPNTNPATIDLDFEKAYNWLLKGAQPTDTVKAILSNEGVLYKKHLMGGVKKGAFDEAEAEKRFEKWIADKNAKLQIKLERLSSDEALATKKQLEAETKIKEERAKVIAAKNAELATEAEALAEQTQEEQLGSVEPATDNEVAAETEQVQKEESTES